MIARLDRAAGIVIVATSLLLAGCLAVRPQQPRALLLRLRVAGALTPLLYDPQSGRQFSLDGLALSTPGLLWSPDGRWLTFHDLTGALEAYNLADGSRRLIAKAPDTLSQLSWSPDSRWLLVRELQQGNLLYVAFDGAPAEPPRRLDANVVETLWSPDSTRLYVRDSLGALARFDVRCLETRAPCVRSLVPSRRRATQLAGWMPGGHDLMIVSQAQANSQPQIYSLNPDDGSARLILDDPLPGVVPVWTPDGKLMAASLAVPARPEPKPTDEGIPGVYLVDTAADTRRLIWTGIAGSLSWSPAGDLLVFDLISRVDSRHSTWLYDRAANHLLSLTPPRSFDAFPTWGTYRGRQAEFTVILLLDAALIAALWATRERDGRPSEARA